MSGLTEEFCISNNANQYEQTFMRNHLSTFSLLNMKRPLTPLGTSLITGAVLKV